MEETVVSKRNMIDTVLGVLKKHELVFVANTGMNADIVLIKAKLVVADGKETFDRRTLGTTKGKNQKYDIMVNGTYKICNSGFAYGSAINDENIKESFNYSLSDIKKGSERNVYDRCMTIASSAIPFETILVSDYNLPTGHLAAQAIANKDFFLLMDAPGKIIEEGKSTKEEMITIYDVIIKILKERMDKMVTNYKDDNSEFFTEYHNARKIGGRGHSTPPVPPVPPSV